MKFLIAVVVLSSQLTLADELPSGEGEISSSAPVNVCESKLWAAPKIAAAAATVSLLIAMDVAVSNYLSGVASGELSRFAQYFNQAAGLGAGIVVARYFEPLWSRTRQFSYRLRERSALAVRHEVHENIWRRDQILRSTMAQYSASVIKGYIGSTRANFMEAFNKYPENLPFAANVLADAAIILRELSPEIPPDEESISSAVHRTFTDNLAHSLTAEFKRSVLERIEYYDPKARDSESAEFYRKLLVAWLD